MFVIGDEGGKPGLWGLLYILGTVNGLVSYSQPGTFLSSLFRVACIGG